VVQSLNSWFLQKSDEACYHCHQEWRLNGFMYWWYFLVLYKRVTHSEFWPGYGLSWVRFSQFTLSSPSEC
jgi:hypothetical protein